MNRSALGWCLAVTLAWPSAVRAATDAIYQWSVPVAPASDQGTRPLARGYLWIPEHCDRVRAVVLGQHNMLEEDVLDHPAFRRAMAGLGVAVVWVSPSMEFRVATPAAAKRFDVVMADLAAASGYAELATAPLLPIGHSAHATFPWNFAAREPTRTLGILSVHGDAPETPLAGFGPQNIRYPDGALDGVPGLMVMGEYEWVDARWAPATDYRNRHPKAPIAMLADIGQGHFAACDDLVDFLAMFVRKCVEYRLPAEPGAPLRPIDPAAGWLVQRWTPGTRRTIGPAPAATYGGDAADAFWAFDRETAEAIHRYRSAQVGKAPQLLGYVQDGHPVPVTLTHPMVTLKFEPAGDGETFTVRPTFLDAVPSMGPGKDDGPNKNNGVRWTGLPAGTPLGHGTGPIAVSRIEGPVEQTGPDAFRLQFYRGSSFDKPVAWFAATHPGDDRYRSAVQQSTMNIPRHNAGADNTITFDPVADTAANTVKLSATSSAGLPVRFYVREGPATVAGNTLTLLPVPPRARFPVAVTVVAWQWGNATARTATPVERSFHITPTTTGP